MGMKDTKHEKELGYFTVDKLAKLGEDKDVIYKVVSKYNKDSGSQVSIRTTKNLRKALEMMKEGFLEEWDLWIKESKVDENEIRNLKKSESDYKLDETYAYVFMGKYYLGTYITVEDVA